jgi:hypothetical protein
MIRFQVNIDLMEFDWATFKVDPTTYIGPTSTKMDLIWIFSQIFCELQTENVGICSSQYLTRAHRWKERWDPAYK